MRDSAGGANEVEDLRRELAALVVDWAGQMVKDDPASPLGQSLTHAVREAAAAAVSNQYQALALKDAELIAASLDRLGAQRAQGRVLGLPRKAAAAVGAASVGVLALVFLLGLLAGRASAPAPPPPAAVLSAPLVDTYLPAEAPAAEPAAAEIPPPEPAKAAPAPERQRPGRAAASKSNPPPRPARPPPASPPEAVSPNAGLVPSSDGATTAAAAAQ